MNTSRPIAVELASRTISSAITKKPGVVRGRVSTALAAILLVACGSAGSWHYESRQSSRGSPAAVERSRIAVLPFEDQRGDHSYHRALLALIPLVPYGGNRYDRIESGAAFLTHSAYQVRPREDLAKALVAELRTSGRFEEVFFTEREQEPNVDFFVRGLIRQFGYRSKMFGYGLGPYGSLLWLLGLPAGRATNRVDVLLQVFDAHTGELIWESAATPAEWTVTIGYYYRWGDEFDGLTELYRGDAERWRDELVNVLSALRSTPANNPRTSVTRP